MKPLFQFLLSLAVGGAVGYGAEHASPYAIGAIGAFVFFQFLQVESKIADLEKALEMHSRRIFPELWE